MSTRLLFMDYSPETIFKVGDKVIWEFEEQQELVGHVSKIEEEEVVVYFPDLKAEDTFYLDGKYTKFEKEPSLRLALFKGQQN